MVFAACAGLVLEPFLGFLFITFIWISLGYSVLLICKIWLESNIRDRIIGSNSEYSCFVLLLILLFLIGLVIIDPFYFVWSTQNAIGYYLPGLGWGGLLFWLGLLVCVVWLLGMEAIIKMVRQNKISSMVVPAVQLTINRWTMDKIWSNMAYGLSCIIIGQQKGLEMGLLFHISFHLYYSFRLLR
jgi:hypothetical protein